MDTGFDFTRQVRRLCEDLVVRSPDLRHIDMARIAICGSQTRKNVRHGTWASLTSLRFEQGARLARRNGIAYRSQRVFDSKGREMLYILRFYLPRFLDLPFRDALATVVHELWHISPLFNGDIRRFAGRCQCHGPRQHDYEQHVASISDDYLRRSPPEELLAFLHLDAAQLQRVHGRILMITLAHPRLIPVERHPD
jgi:predicted metallopeptidase